MEDVDIFGDGGAEDDLGDEIARASTDEIAQRTRMIENEIKVLKNEAARLNHEKQSNAEKIKVIDFDPSAKPRSVCESQCLNVQLTPTVMSAQCL